jgi:hypothetical protein
VKSSVTSVVKKADLTTEVTKVFTKVTERFLQKKKGRRSKPPALRFAHLLFAAQEFTS